MKSLKVVLAMAGSALLLASPAMAFHDGGVANCEGCHTMHNSLGGTVMNATYALTQGVSTQYQAQPYLLQGSQSEACLNCHENPSPGSYHISSPAGTNLVGASQNASIIQFTPGGDFRWLTVAGAGNAKNGHSINAAAYGYLPDTKDAPGPAAGMDAYPKGSLNCSSCHDPHGKFRRTADSSVSFVTSGVATVASGSYNNSVAPTATASVGAYRLLGGVGYIPKSLGAANVAFANAPPIAVAPSTYNVSETSLGGIRVAYGSGMSEWCANCHGSMHTSSYVSGQSGAGTVHPAGVQIGATIAANYNGYVNSSNTIGGSSAAAWNSLIPFETGGTDFSALRTTAGANDQSGPADGTAVVMCLSCHRAHASGFNSMLRFPATSTAITDATGLVYAVDSRGNGAMASNVNDIQTALGNRPASLFGVYQRALCNKCHAKD